MFGYTTQDENYFFRRETRMAHEQNTQTTNSNDNITTKINEQALNDITGNGIGCASVAVLSSIDAGKAMQRMQQTRSLKEATKAVIHTKIATKAFSTASLSPPLCQHCGDNIAQYLAVKTAGL